MDTPKTAEQINVQQTSKVEIPHAPLVAKDVPLAPRILPTEKQEEKTAEKLFQRWNVASNHKGHKGLREDLAKEIEADVNIPAHWKAALLTEIQLHDCKAIEIHAHADTGHGGFILSVHLKPIF